MPNDSAQFASRVYYMAESTPAQIRMRDSLSEVTLNERRFVLGISIIQWFPMREVTQSLQPTASPDCLMTSSRHAYKVRSRKDHRGADLVSDALPFGRRWYRTKQFY